MPTGEYKGMKKTDWFARILLSIAVLSIVVSAFFFTLEQVALYNTTVLNSSTIRVMDGFLTYTFKPQVDAYLEAMKANGGNLPAGQAPVVAPAPLPTNPAPASK